VTADDGGRPGASVVAWYGDKDPGLEHLIRQAQARATTALAGRFRPRAPGEVHATIIGLEQGGHGARLSEVLQYLRARFDQGMTIQFGGFADIDYDVSSRGLRLCERSFTISGRDVMLIGWPVEQGRPSAALDAVRRRCGELGFRHKHYSPAFPHDPDCYLSLGWLDQAAGTGTAAACERQLKRYLSRNEVQVPLASKDISIVVYQDRALTRASSAIYPI
jgi:hypothetical protein